MEISDNDEDFFVRSRQEILALLRGIRDSHDLVTASCDPGQGSIVTTILEVVEDRNALILDYGADEQLNQRLLNSDKVTFDTTHNKVQVKFSTGRLQRTEYDKRNALMMDIPDVMQRIQRRQFHRIDTPIVDAIQCRIHAAEDANGDRVDFGRYAFLEAKIINISIGGMGIVDFPSECQVEKGMLFKECNVELPDVGTLKMDIKVVNAYESLSKKGSRVTHYGCQFIDLNGKMEWMIQRYILQLELERRGKSFWLYADA